MGDVFDFFDGIMLMAECDLGIWYFDGTFITSLSSSPFPTQFKRFNPPQDISYASALEQARYSKHRFEYFLQCLEMQRGANPC